MKNIHSLILINTLIILCLLAIYFKVAYYFLFYIIISLLLIFNLYIILKKSNSLDKREEKQKILLHRIKNSISIIMGYNEAHNDGLISKEVYNENINQEISNIVNILKKELYK
ncbi:hypothetical protein KMP11_03560 [Gemella sp. zg-570]|nr:hypothetical protein KMP11_03560 [Gemella sp. zg-570]